MSSVPPRPASAASRPPILAIWGEGPGGSGVARQVLWTFLFNTAVTLLITLARVVSSGPAQWAAWPAWFLDTWLFANCVGFSIHGLFHLSLSVLGRPRVAAFRPPQRAAYFGAVTVAGALLGYTVAYALHGVNILDVAARGPALLVGGLLLSAVVTLLCYRFFKERADRLEAEAGHERARARALAAEKAAVEAALRALQAQIEPHFLFNTMANVVSLIEAEPATAKRMLESFIHYLRSTLQASRRERATLGDELEIVTAYLDLLKIRMGERLAYRIEVPEALRALPFAPMLLQPLVENAIRHGLEPKIEGGTVRVEARASADRLHVSVRDDGLGLGHGAGGHGVALPNVRERLAALYGPGARLALRDASPGVVATIELALAAAAAPAGPLRGLPEDTHHDPENLSC